MKDTTFITASQELFFNLLMSPGVKPRDVRTFGAFLSVAFDLGRKDLSASVSCRQLANLAYSNHETTAKSLNRLIELGWLEEKCKGNGLEAKTFRPTKSMLNKLTIVFNKYREVNSTTTQILSINNYTIVNLLNILEDSWVLHPVLAKNPAQYKVFAAISMTDLCGIKEIAEYLGMSYGSVGRCIRVLQKLGVIEVDYEDSTKKKVVDSDIKEVNDTPVYFKVLLAYKKRKEKYTEAIRKRWASAMNIARFGHCEFKDIENGRRNLSNIGKVEYFADGDRVCIREKGSNLTIFSFNPYKDVKKYDMGTERSSYERRFCEVNGLDTVGVVVL